MNKIKAVIFDMDGVLIDTEPLNTQYYMRIINEMGASTTIEDFKYTRGSNHTQFWSYFAEKYKIEIPSEENKHNFRLGIIEFLKLQNIQSIPGVKKLIAELYRKNIPIAIASSGSTIRVTEQLKLIKLYKYFKVIVTGHDVKHGKPEPEIFLKAAKRLKVNPANCLVIEDATNGVKAGKAAGMTVIGFAGMDHNKQDLSGADKIIYSFDELTSDIIQSL